MQEKFANALMKGSLEELKEVSKSDIHNHASRGGNIKYFSEWAHIEINPPNKPFRDISEMQQWFNLNIKRNYKGITGYLKCLEFAFIQAHEDHICVLSMSFGIFGIDSFGGIDNFTAMVDILHKHFAPRSSFYPELAIRRETDTNYILSRLDEVLAKNWFKSIDICGYELAQSIKQFKQIYRKAKQYGIRLKAHIGEYGSADDVMEGVEVLELSEVHHGIAAARSEKVMKWLSDHKIQLNICPTSNIMTGLVRTYAEHPVKVLVSYGIRVTINTDDFLIFNRSISEEFLTLYNEGVLSLNELLLARQNGLTAFGDDILLS